MNPRFSMPRRSWLAVGPWPGSNGNLGRDGCDVKTRTQTTNCSVYACQFPRFVSKKFRYFNRNYSADILCCRIKIAMSSPEEDSEMSYDSSCSGDSFIDAIEEENGVSRMVIMGLTGLRDSLRVLAKMEVLPSRVCLWEYTLFSMKWAVLPVNFLFALDFLLMIWRICAIVTEQSHVLNCRMFCILISKVILSIWPLVVSV